MTTSYHEHNHTNPHYISFDEIENAIDSLEQVFLSLSRKDNMKWKWIIGSLIHSLYSFAIANLTGGNYDNVLSFGGNEDGNSFSKRGDEPWKKSITHKRPSGDGYTIEWIIADESELPPHNPKKSLGDRIRIHESKNLISFWSALARVQDNNGQMNRYIFSKSLVLTEEQWKSIEFLYHYALEFLTFIPMSLSMNVEDVIQHCKNILPAIKFLSVESLNILYKDDNTAERIENLLMEIEEKLKLPNEVSTDTNIAIDYREIERDRRIRKYKRMIEKGESEEVEFKSTLRFDVKTKEINLDLETEVLKTICAFLNKRGGTLFIGIEDNKEVFGLQEDYNTLNEHSLDFFLKHLRNLIDSRIGRDAFSQINIFNEIILDKEVCILEIAESKKSFFLKSGKSKDFFVRAASSSHKLTEIESEKYIIAKEKNNNFI